MANSIFDIEIRIDISKEFRKMIEYLHYTDNTTLSSHSGRYYSFINAIDNYSFKHWPYRGTAINCLEFLDNIGLPEYYFNEYFSIDINQFLYYLEFIYNIYKFSYNKRYIKIEDENVEAIINNMEYIAEQINYEFVQDYDKYFLVKRNCDVDSVLPIVDDDIKILLLEYNDFKNQNNLNRKSEILKAIDRYIEKNKSEYIKVDKDSYNSFGYIMNNFGINHKINDKYKEESEFSLLNWYDKCFMLALHLIRYNTIKDINKERKLLES